MPAFAPVESLPLEENFVGDDAAEDGVAGAEAVEDVEPDLL